MHDRKIIGSGSGLLIGKPLERTEHLCLCAGLGRDGLGDLGRDQLLEEDGRDAVFTDEVDDLRHAAGVRLGVGGQALDADLRQTVGIAEIAERLVRNDDGAVRQGRELFAKFCVERVELCGVFFII